MLNSVKNYAQEKNSILSVTQSPATGKHAQRKANLERLRHFKPVDYSFESFMAMCEEYQPKWFKISSKVSSIGIMYAQTKNNAFFGNGSSFEEAFQQLILDIYQ